MINNLLELDSKNLSSQNVEDIRKIYNNKKIKKILLIQPPDTNLSNFNYAAGKRTRLYNYPPYGLGILAAQIRKLNLEVDILNLNFEILKKCVSSKNEKEFKFNDIWKYELKKKLDNFSPCFVGITSMFSQSHDILCEISEYINHYSSNILQGAGGVHVTNSISDPKTFNKFVNQLKYVEFFFMYEADLSFINFLNFVNLNEDPKKLGQTIFKIKKDSFIKLNNRLHPTQDQLNTVPAHDLMNTEDLTKWGKIGSFFCFKPKNTKMSTVLSNRGCRAQCTFCSVRTFNGVGVRRRSVESVIEELKILNHEYGIEHIMWLDDDLLYDKKESIRLFNEIIKNRINITWDATNGLIAAACKDEVISAARDSGCIGVNIGMESGNRKILKEIRKPGTVENFIKAAETFRKFPEINARVFLMIGFPNESYRQILDTINVSNEMSLDWYNVGILQPLPNTPIFDSMVDSGMIDTDTLEFSNIRYNSGGLGKHKQKNRDMLSVNFSQAFQVDNLDEVPDKSKLDDIWAYMNFHLNFKKLLNEDRDLKLKQKYEYVKNITDLVSPENCLALYFLGFLEKKIYGEVSNETIVNLEDRLNKFSYWQERFNQYKLSPNDLKEQKFNFVQIDQDKIVQNI
jgi:radical SAM superfamily enzyme YgiQ (UPF0313 family)